MAKRILQVLSETHLTDQQWEACEAAYQARFPEYRVVVMLPGLRLAFVDAPEEREPQMLVLGDSGLCSLEDFEGEIIGLKVRKDGFIGIVRWRDGDRINVDCSAQLGETGLLSSFMSGWEVVPQ